MFQRRVYWQLAQRKCIDIRQKIQDIIKEHEIIFQTSQKIEFGAPYKIWSTDSTTSHLGCEYTVDVKPPRSTSAVTSSLVGTEVVPSGIKTTAAGADEILDSSFVRI